MKLQIIIILIVIVVIIGTSVYVSGGTNNKNLSDSPEVEYLDSEQTDKSDEFAKIVDYNYGSLTVNGLINGDKAGQSLEVKDIERNDSNIYVSLKSQDTDKIGATVITGYEYNLKLHNIKENDNIYLSYGNNEYHLNISQYKDRDMNVSINRVKSNRDGDNGLKYEIDNGQVKVYGQMTANTGGHSLVINRTNFNNGTLEIYPDLQPPAGIATQVITTYKYEISVDKTDKLKKIAVDNDGEMVEKRIDEISESMGNVTYKFEKKNESEHYMGEIVEKDGDSFVLEGEFRTGSSTCSYVGIDNFEVRNSTAEVKLSATKDRDMNSDCTEDISSSGYRLYINDNGKIRNIRINIDSRFEDKGEKDLNVR